MRDRGASAKLLDLWQAPADAGAPVAVLASTFSFDATFFEIECLGRFGGLQGQAGEGGKQAQLAYLIELEERLADLDVSVFVDRSFSSEGHPLRIDVLPIGLRHGLLHAKATLLVWQRHVRFFLGSANLTAAGYRRQLETATVFDASAEENGVPRFVFEEALAALREIAELIPEDGLPEGPRERALRILDQAKQRVDGFELPTAWPGRLRSRIALSRPGRPALDALDTVWHLGPARDATVVSPFFDCGEKPSAALKALVSRLAQRGPRSVAVVVPVDEVNSRTVVLAPKTLRSSVPDSVDLEFLPLSPPKEDRDRRLHAKAVLLRSDAWTAALLGSSNFTADGLAAESGRGHLELNVAFGLPADDRDGKRLWKLFDDWIGSKPIAEDAVTWQPMVDDEEPAIVLPWGFVRALLDPGDPPRVLVELEPESLPEEWQLQIADGAVIFDSRLWQSRGRPRSIALPLPAGTTIFSLLVTWNQEGERLQIGWPLNVTDRAKLPPREELRNLSVDEILSVLSSTRPLAEALVQALEARKHAPRPKVEDELDPLKRYSSTGHLLARTRDFSRALSGLERHLARPAFSLASLRWRLESAPWSPLALARALQDDASRPGALAGESAFRLAELARTLARLDWSLLAQGIEPAEARAVVARVLDRIRSTTVPEFEDPRLTDYVRSALEKVSV